MPNSSQISDQAQRLKALEPQQSFIVQAPAGSGKTSLLTQRYLKLLAQVNYPEEILAITFTRKAAAEMRQRILKVLTLALEEEPQEAHEKLNWQLARSALKRNEKQQWQLLENPNRLRIQTIDSLCANLSKQLPILSQFGSQAEITSNPEPLYEQAIEDLFNQIDNQEVWTKSLENILAHLDNRLSSLKNLLSKMLAKRDQWLHNIIKSKYNNQLKSDIEAGLEVVTTESIKQLKESLPREHQDQLHQLAQFAAANLQSTQSDSGIIHCWQDESSDDLAMQRQFWLGICELLLTKEKQFRKMVSKAQGFPAPSNAKDKTSKACLKEMKSQMTELLAQLQDDSNFLAALQNFCITPPLHYEAQQWQVLEALIELLPIATAQLRLVFQEHNQVDFVEVAQAASSALGSAEKPTDLALGLDYQIQHILLDEFQDTSISQFQLLEQLTAGWQSNDGRSLFLVGDPMQSIYRFRDAEVGLFLRAQQQGIGNIPLVKLTLTENFRSNSTIVDWVNNTFSQVFPSKNNITNGAISYSASTAYHHDKTGEVNLHPIFTDGFEAKKIRELVSQTAGSTAILVKARSHLFEIIQQLKQHNIPYQAVEIDQLWEQPVIQDLFALNKALLHPADSTAWLSILRAPFCGLLLEDLFIIANDRKKQTIWQRINDVKIIKKLSTASQERLLFVREVLSKSLQMRRRLNLHDWLKDCWLRLNGPHCYTSNTALNDAKTYFSFLDSIERAGDIEEFSQLETQLSKLYATANSATNSVQLLTIHKSKGLEFDQVILPALERSTARNDRDLLLFMERPRQTKGSDLILAPIQNTIAEKDAIYEYLLAQDNIKQQYENARLLYVACTRAKKSLHLFAQATVSQKEEQQIISAPSNSLLKLLWPVVETQFIEALANKSLFENTNADYELKNYNLQRLPQPYFQNSVINLENSFAAPFNPKEAIWHNLTEAAIGSAAHRILQEISLDDLTQWNEARIQNSQAHWCTLLLNFGVLPVELSNATQLLSTAIKNTLVDPQGRWILSQQRNAQAEFAISEQQDQSFQHFAIDRTFIDEHGKRWIIDYKIAQHYCDLDTFIEQQAQQYQAQLESYAELLQQLYNELPHCALYFPLQGVLKKIPYRGAVAS